MVYDRFPQRRDGPIVTRRQRHHMNNNHNDNAIKNTQSQIKNGNSYNNHPNQDGSTDSVSRSQSRSINFNGTSGMNTRNSGALSGASNTDICQTRKQRQVHQARDCHDDRSRDKGREEKQHMNVKNKKVPEAARNGRHAHQLRFGRTSVSKTSNRRDDEVYYGGESDEDAPRTRISTRQTAHADTEINETQDGQSGSSSRISTRRSLRSANHVEADEEHSDPQDEEQGQEELLQRRSSRRRRFKYDSYNEQDITPFRLRRSQKDVDSPPVADGAGHEDDMENMDMYTRVKRARRKIKRDMYGMPLVEEEEKTTEDEETENDEDEEEDEEEEEDEDEDNDEEEEEDANAAATKQYNLRRNKPRTKLYEATIEKKPRHSYFKDTPPKRRYTERSEITFKSPAHRRRKRKRATHATSSTSSSGSESEDERRFARRKNKSMAKARQRCLPMNLTQGDLSHTMKDRQKIGASLADIDPMSLDRSITFDSVGGLSEHLQALKEMIVFPLLYPEVFERFKIAPPRGVLFHGPPGTGKTLVARALANECSVGEKRVAFFMRKGADCLSKWVGESERQLRLLFDQAYQVRPSIIFFDEIDGLAPVRSSRQDQIHSSIVSTLLALMDGLDSRGEVVVIGATNRIDSIDPALRRPGRFDREFLFNLPPVEARAEILKIHTKEWNPKLLDRFIFEVASKCNGYCGADMKALCTEAALHALRRRYPQIYNSSDKLQLDVTSIDISAADFHYAMSKIVPAGQRAVITPSRPLSVIIRPLLCQQLEIIVSQLGSAFPFITPTQSGASSVTGAMLDAVEDDSSLACVTECTKSKRKPKHGTDAGPFLDFSIAAYSKPIVSRPRLLLHGDPAQGHSTHLGPALIHCLEKIPVHVLDIPALYANSARTPEESCSQVFREARRSTPSVIYIPHIDKWWRVLSDTMQATFLMMLSDIDSLTPILLLATSDSSPRTLPLEVRELFAAHSTEQYEVRRPREAEIRSFFEDLLLKQTCVPPPTRKQAARNLLEVLPKVPVSVKPAQLTEAEEKALWNEEEAVLRELRLFLRDMLNKLARDRKFNIFSKPVDDEEVPDYYQIIKTPMDLSTMMSKIDLHQYQACKEFLDDIDLICANALEYNPAGSIAGRAIRHRACALKDTAHALVDAELDEDFEKECRDILESRRNRGKSPSKSAPKYYHTKPLMAESTVRYSKRLKMEEVESTTTTKTVDTRSSRRETAYQTARVSHDITQDDLPTPAKKKRKKNRWASGIASSKKKRQREVQEDADEGSEEDEHQNHKEADSMKTPQINGDISDHEETQSKKAGNPPNSAPDDELPVGDVARAKVDLINTLNNCDNEYGDVKDGDVEDANAKVTVHVQPSTQDSGCVDMVTEELSNGSTNLDSVSHTEDRVADKPPGIDRTEAVDNELSSDTLDKAEATDCRVIGDTLDKAEAADGQVIGDTLDNAHTKAVLTDENVTHQSETQDLKPNSEDLAMETNENSDIADTKMDHSSEHSSLNQAEVDKAEEQAPVDTPEPPVIKELVVELEVQSPKAKRLTRSMTHDPQMVKCVEILEEALPKFVIDSASLPALLEKAVVTGLQCSVTALEKLYSLLAQKIYHYRGSYDRTLLLQELNHTLEEFADRR